MTIASRDEALAQERADEGLLATAWHLITKPAHYRLVHRFRAAAEAADRGRLAELLDRRVALVIDSGAEHDRRVRILRGTGPVVPALIHGLSHARDRRVDEVPVNGQAGLIVHVDDAAVALLTLDVTAGLISMVWIRLHPVELRRGNSV